MMKSSKLLRRSDAYLISFLVPVLVMIAIFVTRGIFPFGEESFLRTDMYHQYAPFFSEFQYKLKSGGSLLYSWDVGMGVNFAALYAYYLASPLNILIVLFPKGLVIEFMTYMIVLKMGLCGLSMCYYLRKHFEKATLGAAFFAIFYALSGYIAAYSWNIMWLDCIILFPLVILGAEKLINDESPVLYVVALAFSILSNYYISIMTCLFLVIYFFCQLITRGVRDWRDFLKKGGRFALYSVLSGGLAMAILLPEIFALQGTASAGSSFPEVYSQYFTIVDMIARHMPAVETEQGLDHWPNIYCGVMVFIFVPLYFMCHKIKLREKVVNLVLILFFMLSFSVNVLNFIWHGLHYPNSLPCRQGYIYVFLILVICYEAYIHIKDINMRQVNVATAAAILLIIFMQKVVTDDAIHFAVYYGSLVFIGLYYMLLYFHKNGKIRYNPLTLSILLIITIESALNMGITSVTYTSRTAYTDDNDDVHTLVNDIKDSDKSFYRFEKMSRKTKDDGAWMNFKSVSIFSSTAYKECSDFFKKVGCEAATNAYSITGSTPLVNMLFAVKYDIYSEQPLHPEVRALEYINDIGNTYLYKYNYALPLGFMMTDKQIENWNTDAGSPALVQNSLADSLEANPVLVADLGTFNGSEYTFTAQHDGEYYVFINNKKIKQAVVNYDNFQKTFDNLDRGFFMEIGYLYQGQEVTVKSETKGEEMDCDAYWFNYSSLEEIYAKLSENPWKITEQKDSRLKGTINATEAGTMMTSIPYDEGWTAYVDGRKTELSQMYECFIGVPISAGEHTVELRYMPKGLKLGALISLISLILMVLCTHLYENGRKRRRKNEGEEVADRYEDADRAEDKAEYEAADRDTAASEARASNDSYDNDVYDSVEELV